MVTGEFGEALGQPVEVLAPPPAVIASHLSLVAFSHSFFSQFLLNIFLKKVHKTLDRVFLDTDLFRAIWILQYLYNDHILSLREVLDST